MQKGEKRERERRIRAQEMVLSNIRRRMEKIHIPALHLGDEGRDIRAGGQDRLHKHGDTDPQQGLTLCGRASPSGLPRPQASASLRNLLETNFSGSPWGRLNSNLWAWGPAIRVLTSLPGILIHVQV